jgi:hypothetical protein
MSKWVTKSARFTEAEDAARVRDINDPLYQRWLLMQRDRIGNNMILRCVLVFQIAKKYTYTKKLLYQPS